MSKRLNFLFPILLFAIVFCWLHYTRTPSSSVEQLQASHKRFLTLKRLGDTIDLSRLERIAQGLPPNAYYEQLAFLTMNPATGYPEPYKVRKLHKELFQKRQRHFSEKAPGDSETTKWYSRGPVNVGGRTRVVLFDPNDPEGKRVFAGAVSGGLWTNQDITDPNSSWSLVTGLPSNLNISCLTIDPRNDQIWYLGTGEQYTAGDVVGTGVYKTTNGGLKWEKVLDVRTIGRSGTGQNATVEGGIFFINDIQAWDNGTFTEIYIAVSTHLYSNSEDPVNFLGFYDRGVYQSSDGGDNWNQVLEGDSFNDFETDASGNLWVVSTYSPGEGCTSRGGKIFMKAYGSTAEFELITTIPDVQRTEIEASHTDPNKFYILAEGAQASVLDPCTITNEAELFLTTDGFQTITKLNEPVDADIEGIPATDFTRGQAFYNLMIESDPNNDDIVYVGGIDLFRSSSSGTNWTQISKWNNSSNLKNLPVSVVHADHHVMSFRPGNSNQAVFGHDGGVSFASDLSIAGNSDVINSPNKAYISSQFYSVAVAPSSFAPGHYFLGGTQDNGTHLFENSTKNSLQLLGGDGGQAFYDQFETDYLVMNLIYNDLIVVYDYSQDTFTLVANNDDSEGFFINPQALDSRSNALFSNGPSGTLYRYDDLDNLEPIGEDGLTDDDPIAARTSLTHTLLDASISAMATSPFDQESSTLLLGLVNGKLLRVENANSTNANAEWEDLTGQAFLGSISDIQFGKNEAEIYLSFYNYGVESIWYTKNGLDPDPEWLRKEGNLPDLPVLSILPNPLNPEEVIVGTELGVWSTENFSATTPVWSPSFNGMSDVKVTDLDIKKGQDIVFAASYGRGIFSGIFFPQEIPDQEEEPVSKGINIYPTVSEGIFTITSGSPVPSPVTIRVFNLQGQLVRTLFMELGSNASPQIDLGREAPGIYFLDIEFSGQRIVKKVIKK